jgi:hypothetical protein
MDNREDKRMIFEGAREDDIFDPRPRRRRWARLKALLASLILSGCSAQQLSQVSAYQTQIASACKVAMALAPLDPSVQPWIVTACSTEAAITTLALDASSLAWLNDLIAQVRQSPLPLIKS